MMLPEQYYSILGMLNGAKGWKPLQSTPCLSAVSGPCRFCSSAGNVSSALVIRDFTYNAPTPSLDPIADSSNQAPYTVFDTSFRLNRPVVWLPGTRGDSESAEW